MGTDCLICCEKFNKSTHKKIPCNFCEYDVCIGCAKQYMFSSIQDIHCMNCKKGWNFDLIEKFYTKKFCNEEYRKYRNDTLFEHEKSMLPATQPYVENEIKTRKLNQEIREIEKEIAEYNKEIDEILLEDISYIKKVKKTGAIKEEIAKLKVQIETIITIRNFISNKVVTASQRRAFIKACPASDCKGFLSIKWKCGVCDTNVCSNCNEIKIEEQEHTCKEENVLSMNLLAKDSKPCPKCAAMIFKIDGCDQMYCVECHTPFSWKTGQIANGTIHNPHYYEYLRRTGRDVPRNPGDNPNQCDGLIDYGTFQRSIITICQKYKDDKQNILGTIPHFDQYNRPLYNRLQQTANAIAANLITSKSIIVNKDKFEEYNIIIGHILTYHQRIQHINMVEIPRHRQFPETEETNRMLRIKYMMNEISEENFKLQLGTRDKNRAKSRENTLIFETFISVISDLMREITIEIDNKTIEDICKIYKNMSELKEYINDSFSKVGKRYKCVSVCINEYWHVSSDAIEKRRAQVRKAELLRKQELENAKKIQLVN